MSWTAVAIAGSAVVGAVASNSASKRQAAAANQASGVSQEQYNQTREDLAPWRDAGQMSLSELQGRMPQLTKPFGMEDFQQSPAYQFNLDQGRKAIEKAAAKRGTYYAPQTLQDVGKYSQGVASNEFQNAFNNYNTNMGNIWNRLYAMSGSGQAAANQTGAFGAANAQNVGNNIMGGANAQAAGTVGVANALNQGVGQYANYQLMDQYLKNQQRSSYDTGGMGGF